MITLLLSHPPITMSKPARPTKFWQGLTLFPRSLYHFYLLLKQAHYHIPNAIRIYGIPAMPHTIGKMGTLIYPEPFTRTNQNIKEIPTRYHVFDIDKYPTPARSKNGRPLTPLDQLNYFITHNHLSSILKPPLILLLTNSHTPTTLSAHVYLHTPEPITPTRFKDLFRPLINRGLIDGHIYGKLQPDFIYRPIAPNHPYERRIYYVHTLGRPD